MITYTSLYSVRRHVCDVFAQVIFSADIWGWKKQASCKHTEPELTLV